MTATQLQGVGVGRLAVVGPVIQVAPLPEVADDAVVERDGVALSADQIRTVVDEAFPAVAADLQQQAADATGTVADVLAATAAIASDPALRGETLKRIDAGTAPIAAINGAVEMFARIFTQAGGLLAERVTDLHSVRDRLVAKVMGLPESSAPSLDEPVVVVAVDLAPADTAALDLDKVLAIVTELGGPTGHTAIIAGQLGLPCVVQVPGATKIAEGTVVAVDAATGGITVNPDDELVKEIDARAAAQVEFAADTSPGATSDGHKVDLLANIGTGDDAERLKDSAVEGVGLFRTEVLFLDRTSAPTIEEQSRAYAQALRALGGRKVVVRTLDAGADKPLAFATLPDEENPALGVRGYRTVRAHPDLMATQLDALAGAAQETGVDPWVMAPMIATPAEAREFVALARARGLKTVGVMVEVPAAALQARALLSEVDFVSLGTNDLAQYTMATDRLRGELSDLLDPWQPAVLQLVASTARTGKELGKPVGVCGESASDPYLALVLTGMGVTSLSMSVSAVPAVRYALRRHDLPTCQRLAELALAATSAPEARERVRDAVEPAVLTALG
ncbi:phosphotransferase system, enzyme I, PtsI [Micrococcales bacterium KH10]|nr:phosphotransferase system, enzyme I, PtsI [Micrococcales bacterium KH10]